MNDEPLIYTTMGNVPESSLTYEHEWNDSAEAIKFVERYKNAAGEVVKESAHVYMKQPIYLISEQGTI